MESMSTSWECIALDGERVPHGKNYVPGPDYCIVCKCEKGKARFCRATLCQPPQDCKSFRVGKSCCDFICLDDILPPLINDGTGRPSSDAGLRMVASAITAFLSLALLLFLIHRLRQRKLRTAQHQYFEDQLEAMSSLPAESCRNNPCCHNAIYLSGNDHVDFFLDGHNPPYSPWKPPPYYFQPGDAPPPYSEVVASDHALRSAESTFSSLNPLMVQLNLSGDQNDQEIQSSQRSSNTHHNLVLNVVAPNELESEVNGDEDRETMSTISPLCDQAQSLALLSDEIYENSPPFPEVEDQLRNISIIPLHPADSLNDLNRGTISSPTLSMEASKQITVERTTSPAAVCKGDFCSCECSHNQERCNVCSASALQSNLKEKNISPRVRPNLQSPVSASERLSVVEDFCLRLRLDISDSSTSSEGPSHPLSLGSISSRSSEDVPSIKSIAEAHC